jgi:hypothetical protein
VKVLRNRMSYGWDKKLYDLIPGEIYHIIINEKKLGDDMESLLIQQKMDRTLAEIFGGVPHDSNVGEFLFTHISEDEKFFKLFFEKIPENGDIFLEEVAEYWTDFCQQWLESIDGYVESDIMEMQDLKRCLHNCEYD